MIVHDHASHSSLREGLIEHLFVGAVMAELWREGCRDFELLRGITDHAGYDVAMEAHGHLRHIQLKASGHTARTNRQNIHTALAKKPSGCVVWIRFDEASLELGPYHWFGASAGEKLPDLGTQLAKHTKPSADGQKADRPNLRVLTKSRFEDVPTLEALVEKLFVPASL